MRTLVFETGESATLRYQIMEDEQPKSITGMTFTFAAKIRHDHTVYAIDPVIGTIDDAADGEFSFDLTMPAVAFSGLYSIVMEDSTGKCSVLGSRPGDPIRVLESLIDQGGA